MKKTLIALLLVASPSVLAAEEEGKCETNIERASNPILEIITVPFKIIAAFSHLPRCLVDYFPVNEENDK
ncbi:hypothetical protein NQX30_02265 [Candidatus Persebacteraceae bacterium Df01]|jgi:hypothetical protein|uniref:Secreted protein n=1 Tax=Candidatus Doriopsillibacter californiensis TaxID=2970740 RepID=A0ABT7QKP0_9GAMM|nr:hypothetical protein [Candidatus Persebacteraceae bacterium Df01]